MKGAVTLAFFVLFAALLVVSTVPASEAAGSEETGVVRVEKHPTHPKLLYITFKFPAQKKKATVEAWAAPGTATRPAANIARLYIEDVEIPAELGGLPDGKPCHLKIYEVPDTLAVGIAQYLASGKDHEFIVWIRLTIDFHPKDSPDFPRRKGYFAGVSFHTPYSTKKPDWLGDGRNERFH